MLCWTAAKQPRREGWVGRGYGNTPLASQLPYHTSLFPPGTPPRPQFSVLAMYGDFVHGLCTLFILSGSFSPESLLLSKLRLILRSHLICQFLQEVLPALPFPNLLNWPTSVAHKPGHSECSQ